MTAGRVGKEDRKAAAQEKKQLGIKDKEDKKGAKLLGKEAWSGPGAGWGGHRGAVEGGRSLQRAALALPCAALEEVPDFPQELSKTVRVSISPSRTG